MQISVNRDEASGRWWWQASDVSARIESVRSRPDYATEAEARADAEAMLWALRAEDS